MNHVVDSLSPAPTEWQPQRYPGAPPPGSSSEWKYEMRREAQMIIPGLWLGPFQSSLKAQRMQEQGITHILCVREIMERSIIYDRFPDQFTYKILEMSDSTGQNVISFIPDCLRFINDAIQAGGTVLAHCNGGTAMSPAIVIAYLMAKYSWPYDRTLSYVQSKRYCVSPTSFQAQLVEYEPIHLAERVINEYSSSNNESSRTKTKRQYEDDDASDDDGMEPRKHPALDDDDQHDKYDGNGMDHDMT